MVCDSVYAELSLQFAAQKECDRFLEESEIRVEGLTRLQADCLMTRDGGFYKVQFPALRIVDPAKP